MLQLTKSISPFYLELSTKLKKKVAIQKHNSGHISSSFTLDAVYEVTSKLVRCFIPSDGCYIFIKFAAALETVLCDYTVYVFFLSVTGSNRYR